MHEADTVGADGDEPRADQMVDDRADPSRVVEGGDERLPVGVDGDRTTGVEVHQGHQHRTRDSATVVVEPTPRVLGRLRHRTGDATDSAISGDGERRVGAPRPGRGEDVGHQGQATGTVVVGRRTMDVGDDEVGEPRLHPESGVACRTRDDLPELGVAQRRQDHRALGEERPESGQPEARTEQVRADGQDNDDPRRVATARRGRHRFGERPTSGRVRLAQDDLEPVHDEDRLLVVDVGDRVANLRARVGAELDAEVPPSRSACPTTVVEGSSTDEPCAEQRRLPRRTRGGEGENGRSRPVRRDRPDPFDQFLDRS